MIKFKSFILFFVFLCAGLFLKAQDTVIEEDGKIRFYYSNGQVSSEGYMRDNQPDGYWITYHQNGKKKSEGNRVDFKLNGRWKFYNEEGLLKLEIDYKQDIKDGLRISHLKDERIEESFIAGVKQGYTNFYYPSNKLKSKTFFDKGREDGKAYVYDEEGTIITLLEYRKGFIIYKEIINRYDNGGMKQGMWKDFYANDIVKSEGEYKNDKKHGYFKFYNSEGNLLTVEKYFNDELQEEAEELVEFKTKTDYYADGSIKTRATYVDNIPSGIRREYAKDGNITTSYIYEKGRIVGQGVVDEMGKKQGFWKEYYISGQLKAEGNFNSSIKIKQWKYYYKDKTLEQSGYFNSKGRIDGEWIWYYPSGNIQREEEYINGIPEGLMTEYDDNGKIIAQGSYIEGLEDGKWFFHVNDYREEGSYFSGAKDGMWKNYYDNEQLESQGKYVDDLPDGRHRWYYDNGLRKTDGVYFMGVKQGDWKHYDYSGNLFLTVYYEDGVEQRYDGTKLEPVESGIGIE